MATATFRIWRGNAEGGAYEEYATEVTEGMVVLDAVHQVGGGKLQPILLGSNLTARSVDRINHRIQVGDRCLRVR